ncbi:MAG TPA: hypothetical protein VFX76_08830, partial [Roseiflexaceae bacterium]|nr:hypothetical protein [Roseiflexaceae bacterium]
MKRRLSSLLVILTTLLVALVSAGIGQASPATQGRSVAPIRLKAATFTPGRGEAPAIPAGLTVAGYASSQRGYYIVQANGAITQAWKDQLAAQGAELLGYVPDNAFKVRATPAVAQRLAQSADVAWVGVFHPAYKLSPELKRTGTQLYKIQIERGADVAQVGGALAQSGAMLVSGQNDTLVVAADAAQLNDLAGVLDVAWIENFKFQEKHNEYGGGAIIGANAANSNGYDGSTQINAVADTGIGGGTAATAHPD